MPELSAQRMSQAPNPAVAWALGALRRRGELTRRRRVVDLGCGKLRHLRVLEPISSRLYLIDTERQLSAAHTDGDRTYTIRQLAEARSNGGHSITALSNKEFAASRLKVDLIFCIAVLDVVTRDARVELVRTARKRLGAGGTFIVVVPRNDTSILDRCNRRNAYQDGHVFAHHGHMTFYRNFRSTSSLRRLCSSMGFMLLEDLSRFRQVCLLFRR